ncbi:MAG: DUF4373 domain-containing protein [Muribaculaceae bacterium]
MNNYFSHDSNARNSDKIIALRMKFGAEGYGIYFMILERMREESNYMSIKDYNVIAFDFRVGTDKIKSIIEDFGLFSFTDDGKRFYSEGFLHRMQRKDIKSVKARESANSRWVKCENDANALRTHCDGNAIKGKESKEKESKETIPLMSPFSDDSFLTIEKLKTYVFDNETVWYEGIAMKIHLSKVEISDWLNAFFDELVMTGEANKSVKDFKSHFYRWLKIKIDKQKKEIKNEKSVDTNVY